jgi:predicted DNA-binding transcriptional regulator YafY
LIRGEPTRVRILFDAKVARYVERAMWHPTQKFRRTGAGLEMTKEVRGTVEVVNWVLGFGENAVVVTPETLRRTTASRIESAWHLYRGKAPPP